MTTAQFRFFGQLNDFLPSERRKIIFSHSVKGNPSIKDTLEALGVPHTEIDYILINGRAADFSYQLQEGDKVFVYPDGYKFKDGRAKRLRPQLPRNFKFVIDSHLGKLARHLRLLGFDVLYKKIFPDAEIVKISVNQKRIVLTRDIGLLKNKLIQHGFWLRSIDPQKQLKEVLKRFKLYKKLKPFSRCLECNGKIIKIAKKKVFAQLPPQVREYYQRFYLCQSCQKIYWQGSHYEYLLKLVNRIRSRAKSGTDPFAGSVPAP